MSASIRRRGCRQECNRTWRYEYGGALPGGPFPGTMADPDDVRLCDHGRVWLATGHITRSGYGIGFDAWERLSPWATPIRYRRAVRAICAEIEASPVPHPTTTTTQGEQA